MTLSAELIKDLDDALADVGQDIVLQRLAEFGDGEQIVVNHADCRANVRAHQPQDQDPGSFGEAPLTDIVLSPTDLAREGWPGLPQKDDRVIIQGRTANIQTVSPIYPAGVLVRINLQCSE